MNLSLYPRDLLPIVLSYFLDEWDLEDLEEPTPEQEHLLRLIGKEVFGSQELPSLSEIRALVFGLQNGWDADYFLDVAGNNLYLTARYIIENYPPSQLILNKALLTAVTDGFVKIVSLLLDNGADIHYKSDLALVEAVGEGDENLATVKLLLSRGANITPRVIKAAVSNAASDPEVLKLIQPGLIIDNSILDESDEFSESDL